MARRIAGWGQELEFTMAATKEESHSGEENGHRGRLKGRAGSQRGHGSNTEVAGECEDSEQSRVSLGSQKSS